jgi:hypothetical protein
MAVNEVRGKTKVHFEILGSGAKAVVRRVLKKSPTKGSDLLSRIVDSGNTPYGFNEIDCPWQQ